LIFTLAQAHSSLVPYVNYFDLCSLRPAPTYAQRSLPFLFFIPFGPSPKRQGLKGIKIRRAGTTGQRGEKCKRKRQRKKIKIRTLPKSAVVKVVRK